MGERNSTTNRTVGMTSDASGGEDADALRTAILEALEDAKCEEIVTIDLAGKTAIADYMIVASGRSARQVNAAAERVVESLKRMGTPALSVVGREQGDWVLIDARDVIAHIFRPEIRAFYNLEKMWAADLPQAPRELDFGESRD